MSRDQQPQERASPHRFRMSRAGVLNVWQYDEQVFDLAQGRLLLRGANGAGKSKTLEMLLPFVLDGDKLRMTASGRHHTSLVWLMTDGYDGNRTGYLWVEFSRTTEAGDVEVLTCGVGVRASSSARSATAWFFTCPRRVGDGLLLEDDAGPLSKERCREVVAPDGHFFEQARAYRQHVGRTLFGLEPVQYDELLRLLYWLRDPQVGEDIEPTKLAVQLAQALPQVDDDAVRAAGVTFDELTAFGEQIERRQRAADGIATFAGAYAAYAASVTRDRATGLVEAHREQRRRTGAAEQARTDAREAADELAATEAERDSVESQQETLRARLHELQQSPEARSQQRMLDLEARAAELSEVASRAAGSAQHETDRAATAERGVTHEGQAVVAAVTSLATRAAELLETGARIGVRAAIGLPSAMAEPVLGDGGSPELAEALEAHAAGVSSVQPLVGERLAAVKVVEQSRQEAVAAGDRATADERRASEAESRAEQERGRHQDAVGLSRAAEADFVAALDRWVGAPGGVVFDRPDLTAVGIAQLGAVARSAAEPELAELRHAEAVGASARLAAEESLRGLRDRRTAIEAEPDPTPPAPALARTNRDEQEGAPLWRLVDFADHVDERGRAGLEAALEASGLLDAWVRPDGTVLSADRLDVVLPLGEVAPGDTPLSTALVPDLSGGRQTVPAKVVEGLLARVAVSTTSSDPAEGEGSSGSTEGDGQSGSTEVGGQAAVGPDGSWRLGPLVGRAAKDRAQYIGATARAAERLRRLAAVEAELELQESTRSQAAERESRAQTRRQEIEAWLAALPSAQDLLTAWARVDERAQVAARAEESASAAEQAAQASRTRARQLREALQALADRHELPVSADALGARRDELHALATALTTHLGDLRRCRDRLTRWVEQRRQWQDDLGHAEGLRAEAERARHTASAADASLAELRAVAGAGIDELRVRLQRTRDELGAVLRRSREVQGRRDGLQQQVGRTSTSLHNAEDHLRAHGSTVVEAAHGLSDIGEVAGLAHSALGRVVTPAELAALELSRGVGIGTRLPAKVTELARSWAALEQPGRTVDTAGLFAAASAAVSSDAGDHEPRVVPGAGDLLAALGRDEGGERAVAELAERLAAAVSRDRELLTERERTLFEEHLIGDLGDLLRRRQLEAADLVQSMNQLLTGVTTSQGISVRLHWKLRDDVPEDARRAVTLLGKPAGALLPGERADLRDALHRLIESSRAEAPEDSYAEHLARALDYRVWHVFQVRYTRPELKGEWHQLHRRTPLSQGEQKVVCYLPLFAAAAAHFTSLAGAAPYAPRFVLLDDAFPKIDVRTHPLLFGLLVDLELDFVITSERLWGDHSTVPSLAIYEALRDPSERGIAQYRYIWDGARLQSVGA